MAENPIFNINFVKAIQKRPCIWNFTLADYSKRNTTERAWIDVANEVNDSVNNCRERWRNIRGSFLRSLKRSPGGPATNPRKKYYLNQYLEFLLPFIKAKDSTENIETEIDCSDPFEDSSSESEDQKLPIESIDVNAIPISSIEMSQVHQEFDSGNEKFVIIAEKAYISKKPKMSHNISNISDDYFIELPGIERDCSKEHPYMSFLRSLLPDMMKMTEKQNRRFRRNVVGLMDDILDDKDIRHR